jgi:hypothetical protein
MREAVLEHINCCIVVVVIIIIIIIIIIQSYILNRSSFYKNDALCEDIIGAQESVYFLYM